MKRRRGSMTPRSRVLLGTLSALGLSLLVGALMAGNTLAADREVLETLAAHYYDQEFRDHAAGYHRLRITLFFVQVTVVLITAWFLAWKAPALWRKRALALAGGRPWLARGLLLTGLHFGFALLRLPFSVTRYLHATRYDLRHDPWPSYLMDWFKAVGIGWVLVLVVGLLVLGLFVRWPRWWWAASGAATAVLAVGYVILAPIVIDPLFNQFQKLDDPDLETRLLAICREGGVDAEEIWVADASRRTRAANAYITGLGGSRRIVLYDTLVENFESDEVSLILAHEVGHWRLKHIPLGVSLGVAGATAGLWVAHVLLGGWLRRRRGNGGRGDPALVFPAYALYLSLMLAAMVPSNWISRQFEADADRESLILTEDPDAFIRAEVRLAKKNLSDVLPPSWIEFTLYTHPANIRRISMAEEFR